LPRRKNGFLSKFAHAAPNGLFVAPEKLRQINQTASPQLKGFGASKETPLSFAQGLEQAAQSYFGWWWQRCDHVGILPASGHPLSNSRRIPKNRRAKKSKEGS
jgi:hypothetical protein